MATLRTTPMHVVQAGDISNVKLATFLRARLAPVEWPLLGALSAEEAQLVLSAARRRRFARGEVVFHRGDPADTLHLVAKGRLAARVTTSLGDTVIFSVLGPRDFFGELALLGDAVRTSSIVALEESETRALHRLDFERLRSSHAGVDRMLMQVLAQQVRRLSAHLVEALYLPAEQRILRRLVEVAAAYGTLDQPVTIPLTQEHIAELAGTSRATVNRVLREEAQRGTVELKRGKTTLRDPSGLRRGLEL